MCGVAKDGSFIYGKSKMAKTGTLISTMLLNFKCTKRYKLT